MGNSPNLLSSLVLACTVALAGCDASETVSSKTAGIGTADAAAGPPASDAPRFSISLDKGAEGGQALVVVHGLSAVQRDELAKTGLAGESGFERLQTLFRVIVLTDGAAADLPMLGRYRMGAADFAFEPRFPFRPGVKYRAIFEPAKLSSATASAPEVVFDFSLPKSPESATTVVRAVYPSAKTLPENQLKFYIAFSAPMSRGEAYHRVHLVRSDGSKVDLPFLELAEELWDPAGSRLTLLFDPGRIKQGLKPREEVGPALQAGKSYTLVIDREWLDASGNPLAQSFRKSFDVAAPDTSQPDIDNWTLTAPAAGAREPLVVQFPEPLDHAMLERVLIVTDAAGQPVAGTIEIDNDETRWRFRPASAWSPGSYHLVVDSALEDLAGNSIAHPFEVDLQATVERKAVAKTVTRPFEVRPLDKADR